VASLIDINLLFLVNGEVFKLLPLVLHGVAHVLARVAVLLIILLVRVLPPVIVLLRRHRHRLRLPQLVLAFGAWVGLVLLVGEALSLDVIVAEAYFALHASVLTQPVARYALVIFSVQLLARCLVLELVVFAEELVAEGALVNPPSVRPNVPLALNAHGVQQGALASVHLQALSPVAHPSLAYVAYRAHHPHSSCMLIWMFYNTIRRLHTLLLSTMSTHWQLL